MKKPTLIFTQKYIEKWITLSLPIFLLGYFFFPSSSLRNTFYYIAVCFPVVLLLPAYYRQFKPTTWVTASSIIFIFYLLLNSLWSIHYSTDQSLKFLRYVFSLYCLFAAVFIFHNNRPGYCDQLFKAFIFFGFFHSLYGIFIHFNMFPKPLTIRYDDPIESSMLVGLLMLTCIWLMIESKSWRHSAIYFFLSIPFIIIMILSKSRGPQMALILTLPLIAYFQSQYIKKLIYLFLIPLFAIIPLILFPDFSKIIFDRGFSAPYRIEIWSASFNESLNYFWFGQGASHRPPLFISSGERFNHSHNILLSIFRMGGIVGVILFFTNLILCFFAGLKSSNSIHRVWIVWLCFGVLCLMTNGKYPLIRPSSAWLVYWIPIAFICASYSNFLSIKHNE